MSDEPLPPDEDDAPPADPFEADLVAYLDGELDAAAARKVEVRLAADPAARRITATLTDAVPRNPGRDEAVRVALHDTPAGRAATPTGPQGSHQLTSMLGADGLALVTAGEGTLAPGADVAVELL